MGDSDHVHTEIHVGLDTTGDPVVVLLLEDGEAHPFTAGAADQLAVQLLHSSATAKAMAASFRDLTMNKGWAPERAAAFLQERG